MRKNTAAFLIGYIYTKNWTNVIFNSKYLVCEFCDTPNPILEISKNKNNSNTPTETIPKFNQYQFISIKLNKKIQEISPISSWSRTAKILCHTMTDKLKP